MIKNLAPQEDDSSSIIDQTINANTTALLAGSVLNVPADKLRVGSIFRWKLALTKTAAGTQGNIFAVQLGINGTVADADLLTFTLPTATGVIDTAFIEIEVVVRGPLGASCKMQGQLRLMHNLQITGFATVPTPIINALSANFDSTTSGLKLSVACITAVSTILTFQQVIGKSENLI
jgi:hypothetical protein